MANYFSVSGYWKDDIEDVFSGYIVKDTDDFDEWDDDDIFYYGLSEDGIKQVIEDGVNGTFDFVITDYVPL